MKDINIIYVNLIEYEEFRTITPTHVAWMLGAGWMFYFVSLLLNLVYYLMHPSSPELWTWGAAEELEGWTPPEKKETETRKETNQQIQRTEGSQLELAELLPQESDDKQNEN